MSPLVKNPEQSADEDAEKNEEDSEGEGGALTERVTSPQLVPLPCFLGCPSALLFITLTLFSLLPPRPRLFR